MKFYDDFNLWRHYYMSGEVRIGSHVFRSFLISKSFYKDIG